MDSIFTRLTNVKTGEVLENIELDKTLYYEFRANKYCLGYAPLRTIMEYTDIIEREF